MIQASHLQMLVHPSQDLVIANDKIGSSQLLGRRRGWSKSVYIRGRFVLVSLLRLLPRLAKDKICSQLLVGRRGRTQSPVHEGGLFVGVNYISPQNMRRWHRILWYVHAVHHSSLLVIQLQSFTHIINCLFLSKLNFIKEESRNDKCPRKKGWGTMFAHQWRVTRMKQSNKN